MTIVERQTYLAAKPERIWAEVRTARLLRYVTRGMIRFSPRKASAFPDVWAPGEYQAWMFLFGWMPIGWQAIRIELPEPQAPGEWRVRDNGYGPLIRRWDHWIILTAEQDGTRYVDRIEIDAGPLTPPVALFAGVFYAHRQKRWRKLVACNFDYDAS